jgi:dihydroorotase
MNLAVDLILKNAKVYLSGKIIEAGIAIDGERIVKVAKETNLPSASEKIDLDGLLILPGIIDVHVHLRDQELSYKEDFYSGTCAAANGGVSLVVDMPNNKPVTMDSKTLRERMELASRKVVVNTAFYSAFPENMREIKRIKSVGARAFKIFLSHKVGGLNPDDENAVIDAFKEVAENGLIVAVHAEDGFFLRKKIEEVSLKNRDDLDAYLEVHSPEAEVKGVKRAIGLMRKSNVHVHICHVSVADGLKAILGAKSNGYPITCEITSHHLLLSEKYLRRIGNIALTNPPLRSLSDASYLRWALENNLVDIVASDHAPHAIFEKDASSIWNVSAGIAGIETMLPLMLNMVNIGQISIPTLVRSLSEKPSRIFKFKDRGRIMEGAYADLVVVDLKKEWTIDSTEFYSKAKFSPFDGWRIKGKPAKTFANGILVMDEGEIIVKPGSGKVIGWQRGFV